MLVRKLRLEIESRKHTSGGWARGKEPGRGEVQGSGKESGIREERDREENDKIRPVRLVQDVRHDMTIPSVTPLLLLQLPLTEDSDLKVVSRPEVYPQQMGWYLNR